jgi:probable F420-dependent oxidoreductase
MIRVGLHVPHFGPIARPDVLARSIDLAEELGFDTVWVSDHVAIPVGFETPYPYTATGQIGLPAETPFYDPFVALSFAAGRTERVRLGISALVLPYRHPLLAAKLIGSLDAISSGRARIVIGAGWLREEFDALGVDFKKRGRITDEYADALSALLDDGRASFAGEMVGFEEMGMEPAPVQRPFPLLVGGHSNVAMRRALRLGHGWQATPEGPGEVDQMLSRLRAAAGGEISAGFLVATRLHLPKFDANEPGDRLVEMMRSAVAPGISDLTVDAFDRDAERYYARVEAIASWLDLKEGTTEVLD